MKEKIKGILSLTITAFVCAMLIYIVEVYL